MLPLIRSTSSRQGLDKNTRKDLVWQMQQIVLDQVVYIIPFYTNAVQAYALTLSRVGSPINQVGTSELPFITVVEPVK